MTNHGDNIKGLSRSLNLPLVVSYNVIIVILMGLGLMKIAEEECGGFFVILTTNQFYKAPLQRQIQVQYLRWKSWH